MQHSFDTQTVLNIGYSALGNHLSMLDYADLIHHFRKLRQNMRRNNDRLAHELKFLQDFAHFNASPWVQS
ncbi:hypothetical protein D3C73_1397310 [compost metagenome]